MTTTANSAQLAEIWANDALQRKPYADFLTKFLTAQTRVATEAGYKPYCLAIDAPWGAGKTYFVSNWCAQLQLENLNPAFRFDAWATDYHSDPLIAFMSALKTALQEEIKKTKLPSRVQTQAKSALTRGVKALGKLAVPLATDVALSSMKAVFPGAVAAAMEMVRDGRTELSDDEIAGLGEATLAGAKKGAAHYFQHAIAEQSKRADVLQQFRESVSESLKLLEEHGSRTLPLFVFVDELDRCRPTYAIELLETMKHVFNIPGVCFVVSTNMDQLSHAVTAVYGQAFNARDYLQRFFESECTLPAMEGQHYAHQLIGEYPLLRGINIKLGLPPGGFTKPFATPSAALTIEWVATTFKLDLRSQQRMLAMINACVTTLQEKPNIHLLWLATLCAAKIRSSDLFNSLRRVQDASPAALWNRFAPADFSRQHQAPESNEVNAQLHYADVVLFTAIGYYRNFLERDPAQFAHEISSQRSAYLSYPKSILLEIRSGLGNRQQPETDTEMPHKCYGGLVELAGHMLK